MASINHYRQKIERSCFCGLGVSILSLSSILIFDFGIYYFLHFALNLTVELDNDLVLICHTFIEKSQNNLGHDIDKILLKVDVKHQSIKSIKII
jgi:hypothetical protein